jgi:hypothetical protein
MEGGLTRDLKIIGVLNDDEGPDSAQSRLRKLILPDIGPDRIRSAIEECTSNSGDNYNKALQDLTNRLGELYGFTVGYGRYRGTRSEKHNGMDGHWKYKNYHIIIETKTSTAYTITIGDLLGYIRKLKDERVIGKNEPCIGLYVIGRQDNTIKSLSAAIVGSGNDELKIITVDMLLKLYEKGMRAKDLVDIVIPSPCINKLSNPFMRIGECKPEVSMEEPRPAIAAMDAAPSLKPRRATKVCAICGQRKSITKFVGNTNSYCKECQRRVDVEIHALKKKGLPTKGVVKKVREDILAELGKAPST